MKLSNLILVVSITSTSLLVGVVQAKDSKEASFAKDLRCVAGLENLEGETSRVLSQDLLAIPVGNNSVWHLFTPTKSYRAQLGMDPQHSYEVKMDTDGNLPGPLTVYQLQLPGKKPQRFFYSKLTAQSGYESKPKELEQFSLADPQFDKKILSKTVPKEIQAREDMDPDARASILVYEKRLVQHLYDHYAVYEKSAPKSAIDAKPFLQSLDSCKDIAGLGYDVEKEKAKFSSKHGQADIVAGADDQRGRVINAMGMPVKAPAHGEGPQKTGTGIDTNTHAR